MVEHERIKFLKFPTSWKQDEEGRILEKPPSGLTRTRRFKIFLNFKQIYVNSITARTLQLFFCDHLVVVLFAFSRLHQDAREEKLFSLPFALWKTLQDAVSSSCLRLYGIEKVSCSGWRFRLANQLIGESWSDLWLSDKISGCAHL